ncbi:hypothetical protein GOP47_0020533 [Adiantum capillus-veneris]|uniref:PIH1 N-terminal domain-containing protein n=1 Tax=Adiantum capillus-veneris TaxID=13818 RepID=A0A9D4Z661_ADICA|nr:hypothetical protein GOP47_0020533 [Adiantum capillus-veneris]
MARRVSTTEFKEQTSENALVLDGEAESYIKMVEEQSRGGLSMKGKDLVIPTPEFCVKTHDRNTNSKLFINVCHSDKIELPQNKKRVDGSGVDWHIPFSLSPIRKDKDKGGADCIDVDYVVNQEAASGLPKSGSRPLAQQERAARMVKWLQGGAVARARWAIVDGSTADGLHEAPSVAARWHPLYAPGLLGFAGCVGPPETARCPTVLTGLSQQNKSLQGQQGAYNL